MQKVVMADKAGNSPLAVVYLPILNRAFGTTPLRLVDWAVAIGLASLVLGGEEVKKIITRAMGFHKHK